MGGQSLFLGDGHDVFRSTAQSAFWIINETGTLYKTCLLYTSVAGVEVKNEGEGQVVVDDVSVEKGQSTTTTGSAGTEPEPEPESKPESDRDEEEEFGKVEVGGTDSDSNNTDKDNPQTGDDNGLELATAAMLILYLVHI